MCPTSPELSVDPPDARRLVEAMARGDTTAIGALYDRFAPLLLAVTHRILQNRPEAEDLVHEVFLEAWRHAGEYDPARGSVRSWLVLRARSRALDVRKSAAVARTVRVGNSALLERVAIDDEPPSRAPDRDRVRRALAALPEEQRSVLFCGYFEGLSSREIAERMELPIGTVKSRVAAALARLRTALGAEASP